MACFDLHIHTTASDGSLPPRQVVRAANALGLAGIAITDHDTIEGIPDALQEGLLCNLQIFPGVELSTEFAGRDIHILGYFMDFDLKWLEEKLLFLQQKRQQRMRQIIQKLNDYGFCLQVEDVFKYSIAGSVGRPHVAMAMVEKGYVDSIKEAFDNYLGKNCVGYVERYKISALEAIATIHRCHGVAVLAHPGLIVDQSLLPALLELNFDGIEVNHPDHKAVDKKRYQKLAKQHHLAVTGGSDFHASHLGCCTISEKEVLQLQAKRATD